MRVKLTPLVLTLGVILSIYVFLNFDSIYKRSQVQIGLLEQLEGTAVVQMPDELVDSEIAVNDAITNGTIIRTSSQSSAVILLNNRERIEIGENTVVEISKRRGGLVDFVIMGGQAKPFTKEKLIKTNIKKKIGVRTFQTNLVNAINSTKISGDPVNKALDTKQLSLVLNKPTALIDGFISRINEKKKEEARKEEVKPEEVKEKESQKVAEKLQEVKNAKAAKKKKPLRIVAPKANEVLALKEKSILVFNSTARIESYSPKDKIWVRSSESPLDIQLKVANANDEKFFISNSGEESSRTYFSKLKNNTLLLRFDFNKNRHSTKLTPSSSGFNRLEMNVWVENPKNKRQIKSIGKLLISFKSVGELQHGKYKVVFSRSKKRNRENYVKHTERRSGTIEVLASNVSEISELWRIVDSIHSIEKTNKFDNRRKYAIAIKGDRVAYISKDKKFIRNLVRQKRLGLAGYYGKITDYVGYLGEYPEVKKFLKSKKMVTEGKMLYFLYENKLLPISTTLLWKDSSAYNLLNKKYEVVFLNKVEFLK